MNVKKYYQNSPPHPNIIEQIPNHFIKSTCLKLDNIIKNMPEIADLKEPLKSKNQRKCIHNSICYDVECRNAHTYIIEARKKIREAFLKEMKNEKINEIIHHISTTPQKPLSGQKLMTDYYKPITERTSKSSLYPEPSQTLKEKQKYNKYAQIYLEVSTRTHKELIKKKEKQRLQQQEYEETKQKIKEQLHSLVEMPSRLFGRLMSSSSKKLDTKVKINIWSDKIIEMISEITLWKSDKCENLDECIEKITIIIDIINSFVERPNTMIYNELPKNNKYNIQKNKIYENFLYNYKITFTDKELEHPEYLKLFKDYKKIIIVLQNMKLDDCKNTFSEEKTGGKKLKTLKSKSDLKNKKRKEMKINQSQKKQ